MRIDAKVRLALAFLLGPTLLLLTLLAALFVLDAKTKDWQLVQLQNDIGALQHPPGSRFVARHGLSGDELFGNGHHFDFWAVELRSFSGSRAALQGSYEGLRVPVPSDDDYYTPGVKDGTQPVEIEFLPSPLPANFHLPMGASNRWNLARCVGRRQLYLVQVVNSE